MEPREVVAEPAAVLALAEEVCPSLNGAASFRLAEALEAIDAGLDLQSLGGLEKIAKAIGALDRSRVERWTRQLDRLGCRFISVLDDEYPNNLRMVHDHPPFLFVRGTLDPADERAVAVVGTRQPGAAGRRAAARIARVLAERGITVVSGLAAGIDTAAHSSALDAGGRTLGVFGTGVDRIYPAANRALAKAVEACGANLSQFWPDMPPTRWSFPVRNIVTSGLSLATVVIEAGPTSGARQQAEHALRHGKRLYLMRRLVQDQPWARSLIGCPGVLAIDDAEEVLAAIELELDLQADVVV